MRPQRAPPELEQLLASPPPAVAAPTPVRLVVLPVAELTAAGACVARQRAADPAQRLEASPGERAKLAPIAFLSACRACPDGELVAHRLEVKLEPVPRRGRPSAAWPLIELALAPSRHVAAALSACTGSRRAVALRIGVPVAEVQRLVQGAAGVRVREASLEAIARAVGVTREQLLAGKGPDGATLPRLDVPRPSPRRVVRPAR